MVIFELAVVWVLLWFIWSIVFSVRAYRDALSLEKQGKYADACLRYLDASHVWNSALCKQKIRTLWRSHGPFDFSWKLEEIKKRNDPAAGCDEHALYDSIEWIKKIGGS